VVLGSDCTAGSICGGAVGLGSGCAGGLVFGVAMVLVSCCPGGFAKGEGKVSFVVCSSARVTSGQDGSSAWVGWSLMP